MTSVPSARALRGLAYASLVFLAWCGGDDGGGGRAQGANAALADVSASSNRPAPGGEPAILTSPPPGTKFASRSATFVWTNTGANQYGFAIQSTSSATPVVDTVTSATTLTVTNLPTDGAGLVVRLRSRFKGKWLPSNEYSFTAAGYTAAQSTAAVKPWSDPIALPLVPASAANLPDGKLLLWAARSPTSFSTSSNEAYTYTSVFDPATRSSSPLTVTATGHQMFCPGLSMLADGSVLVTGGSDAVKTSIYDPALGGWVTGAQLGIARAYQSSTTMSDGSVFTVGGSWNGGLGGKYGEVWSASTSTWRTLSGVPANMPDASNVSNPPLAGPDAAGVYRGDNHMWLFGAAGGWVFHAGPAAAMHWIDTRGSGAILQAGPRSDDPYAMTASAVMYDIGKILKLGGAPNHDSGNAFKTAYIIDINAGAPNPPTVRKVSPMAYGRTFVNSVVLPNGEVLVIGGQTQPVTFSDSFSVLATELWSPVLESFITLPPMQRPRNYHSVALLLLDGRVLAGGGGLCACPADHPDAEIYTPPYLLAPDGTPAPRPAITAAPATATWGSQIAVATDRAAASFALVRMASATHSVNTDQRRIPLSFTGTAGNYQLGIPADRGVVLPGNYMLFALDGSGVPSVARTINIR
ncbi:galactose oxidase [Variovorax sp. CF079]|uniref:galactose oxidase-like domain-containing protein n=1 Tax=Variovorax sp. CF079 TaxID=1882774 RepID=UPI000890F8FB|nr:galactose oxidase-like domain-containing protein [Variovorax sp. CF079]SDC59692.1 galactose oxidase [Variovorax sp. CF079]